MESIELKKILIMSTHHNVKTYINHTCRDGVKRGISHPCLHSEINKGKGRSLTLTHQNP